MAKVALLKCSYSGIGNSLARGIRLAGFRPNAGRNVLLKVNLLTGAGPKKAVTTHPAVVEAAVRYFQGHGCKVSVGDSPCLQSAGTVAKAAGIAEVCQRTGARLVELDLPEEVKYKGTLVHSLVLSARLREFDLIVNMPKLKTHALTGMTGAVKNMFGCVPGRNKGFYHLRFTDRVLFAKLAYDICCCISPALTIMDAVVAMEGMGPGQGVPRGLGCLIVSKSSFAADIAAMRLIGFSQNENLITRVCPGARAGTRLVGDSFEPAKNFVRAGRGGRLEKLWDFLFGFADFTTKRPKVLKTCTGCGDCARACPAGAITILGRAEIDYSRCIKCYCCHEVCRYSSMVLSQAILARALCRACGIR